MSKEFVKIGVRVVERPAPPLPQKDGEYRPPKKPVFKAIATCRVNGKNLSRTATAETETESIENAFSKLATLVAKNGAVPSPGYVVSN
ncbi:MAG: hypothetical protein P1U42_12245 [Phycisphaerales bacterium]|nr:hypothetical protein [Phycisphaerales bacterium]